MTFQDLGISPGLCEALRSRGIKEATAVQERAIPVLRAGRDAIVQSQTGTGKTLAFLLPLLEKIKPQADVAQGLVVTPTRELAIQIAKVADYLGEALGVSSLVIYGGQDIERQKMKLRRQPQLIIGTPGRLLDHLRRGTLDLSHVNKVVLDEADEMMKLGFIEDVEVLLKASAGDRQFLLFSATVPDRVKALAAQFMRSPERIEIKGNHVILEDIEQVVLATTEEGKLDKLCGLINDEQPYLMMVFCHTKQRVHQLMMALAERGYLVDELHGDLTQTQRTLVLRRFRKAELQVLCATDIAARGLDIEGVTHVVSYDIPRDTESYIHRIGRTGRAGRQGKAITFVNARQYDRLRRIEAGIREHIRSQKLARVHAAKKTATKGTDAQDSQQARPVSRRPRVAAKVLKLKHRHKRPSTPVAGKKNKKKTSNFRNKKQKS